TSSSSVRVVDDAMGEMISKGTDGSSREQRAQQGASSMENSSPSLSSKKFIGIGEQQVNSVQRYPSSGRAATGAQKGVSVLLPAGDDCVRFFDPLRQPLEALATADIAGTVSSKLNLLGGNHGGSPGGGVAQQNEDVGITSPGRVAEGDREQQREETNSTVTHEPEAYYTRASAIACENRKGTALGGEDPFLLADQVSASILISTRTVTPTLGRMVNGNDKLEDVDLIQEVNTSSTSSLFICEQDYRYNFSKTSCDGQGYGTTSTTGLGK
ncbi:unnamed protein product, partial [Amoebophrya sp. A25]